MHYYFYEKLIHFYIFDYCVYINNNNQSRNQTRNENRNQDHNQNHIQNHSQNHSQKHYQNRISKSYTTCLEEHKIVFIPL